jgi:hypothetical protein
MTDASGHDYLQQQYGTTSNLDARVALHQRYSTHPLPWHEWVFDQFDLPPQALILELGCGPGSLSPSAIDSATRARKKARFANYKETTHDHFSL